MLKIKLLFVVVALAVNHTGKADVPDKLFLSVYYESACPDSKSFILKQLEPAVQLLHKDLILRLVPFGKATSIKNNVNGEIRFQCQHGPRECLGNIIQDCTLDLMTLRTDIERVRYVACEMKTLSGIKGDFKCVANASVSVQEVTECISSARGTALQLSSEILTKRVKPKFIPTVTINEVFNQQIQDQTQRDLIGTLCSILKNTETCADHYNTQALQYVLL